MICQLTDCRLVMTRSIVNTSAVEIQRALYAEIASSPLEVSCVLPGLQFFLAGELGPATPLIEYQSDCARRFAVSASYLNRQLAPAENGRSDAPMWPRSIERGITARRAELSPEQLASMWPRSRCLQCFSPLELQCGRLDRARNLVRWPLWTGALTAPVIRSVLTLNLESMAQDERAARGIGVVFNSGIKRSDQGGYGSFEPASVI